MQYLQVKYQPMQLRGRRIKQVKDVLFAMGVGTVSARCTSAVSVNFGVNISQNCFHCLGLLPLLLRRSAAYPNNFSLVYFFSYILRRPTLSSRIKQSTVLNSLCHCERSRSLHRPFSLSGSLLQRESRHSNGALCR